MKNYEQSEDYSIDRAIDLLKNGLKVQGSRHNSTLLIGMYLKYSGLDQEQCNEELHSWMNDQNPDFYSSTLEESHKDIDQIVNDIYERNYDLRASNKDLTVTMDEMKWIIESCPEKNQKLITYAMLIHSKRHANMEGVFYMPFKDIEAATGIYDQAIQNQMNKLIDLNVVELIERNRIQKGKGLHKKLPNLYRLNVSENCLSQNKAEVYVTQKHNDIETCLKFYFTEKELKKILPRRQFKSLIG
ncbi:hypothetical protein D3C74_344880 [compost metagenome]